MGPSKVGNYAILLAFLGVCIMVAGLTIMCSSDRVDASGVVVDKEEYWDGRRIFIVEMDDGTIEREIADDQMWYTHEVGDRITIQVYQANPKRFSDGGPVLFVGALMTITGYLLNKYRERKEVVT